MQALASLMSLLHKTSSRQKYLYAVVGLNFHLLDFSCFLNTFFVSTLVSFVVVIVSVFGLLAIVWSSLRTNQCLCVSSKVALVHRSGSK